MKIIILFTILSNFSVLLGHGGEKHGEKPIVKVAKPRHSNDKLHSIQNEYKSVIEPIFKRSCFNCHSGQTNFPWYYKIPIVKQIMNGHISDAKSHLDFSNGYPFKSHDTKLNDLKSIGKSVSDGHMPPWYYIMLNKDDDLTPAEVEKIQDWVNQSIEVLR